MKRAEAQKRISDLREQIRRHDHIYYVEARPEISDYFPWPCGRKPSLLNFLG
jgi:NAD-dependent DNA ligase